MNTSPQACVSFTHPLPSAPDFDPADFDTVSILRTEANSDRISTWAALQVIDLNKEPIGACPNCCSPFENLVLDDVKPLLNPLELKNLEVSHIKDGKWVESRVCWHCYVGTDYISFLKSKKKIHSSLTMHERVYRSASKKTVSFCHAPPPRNHYKSYCKQGMLRYWKDTCKLIPYQQAQYKKEKFEKINKRLSELKAQFSAIEIK